jgi:hypothetical protein
MGSFAKWGRKKEETNTLCGIHHLVQKSEFFTQKKQTLLQTKKIQGTHHQPV